jgi:hypothetical protein
MTPVAKHPASPPERHSINYNEIELVTPQMCNTSRKIYCYPGKEEIWK